MYSGHVYHHHCWNHHQVYPEAQAWLCGYVLSSWSPSSPRPSLGTHWDCKWGRIIGWFQCFESLSTSYWWDSSQLTTTHPQISFFSRALSLGVRLGANLTAGHMIMHILADFSAQMISAGTPLRYVNMLSYVCSSKIVRKYIVLEIVPACNILTSSVLLIRIHVRRSTRNKYVHVQICTFM